VRLKLKAGGSQSRFAASIEAITLTLGHADRAGPFRSYCAGAISIAMLGMVLATRPWKIGPA
jgi:hypothetical protein